MIPKAAFAKEIVRILRDEQLTQTEAGYITHEAPSQISLIVSGKLRGFAAERLVRLLTKLGRDVEFAIRPARGRKGKVTVTCR